MKFWAAQYDTTIDVWFEIECHLNSLTPARDKQEYGVRRSTRSWRERDRRRGNRVQLTKQVTDNMASASCFSFFFFFVGSPLSRSLDLLNVQRWRHSEAAPRVDGMMMWDFVHRSRMACGENGTLIIITMFECSSNRQLEISSECSFERASLSL